jgi:hypothetical protein
VLSNVAARFLEWQTQWLDSGVDMEKFYLFRTDPDKHPEWCERGILYLLTAKPSYPITPGMDAMPLGKGDIKMALKAMKDRNIRVIRSEKSEK